MSLNSQLASLREQAAKAQGTVAGAGMGLLVSFLEKDDVRESLEKDKRGELDEALGAIVTQLTQLGNVRRLSDMPGSTDFFGGLLSGRPLEEGGANQCRPERPTASRVRGYDWPPLPTAYQRAIDSIGNPVVDCHGRPVVQMVRRGQLLDVGQFLATPEVAAALGGLVLTNRPTEQQLVAILDYFGGLMAAAAGTPLSAAIGAWIAANSPAYADPALDVPWAVTGFSPSALTASAAITSAGLGAIVAGAQGTALFKYGYNQEQQTPRSFRLQVTPSTTAGVQFSAYLPQALRNNGAPKAHLQVEGLGVVASGSPYVSAAVGGATPYITVSTGTNPAATTAYNLLISITN